MRFCPNCDYSGTEKVCPDCNFPMLSREGTLASPAEEHPLIGEVFEGRYRILELIGEGASGFVFKAEHVTMGQGVALKVLRHESKQNIQLVKRFISEAKTSSQLRDPHTVRVFDFGESDSGELYIAMEWLVGTPLSDVIDKLHHLPAPRVAHIVRQICFGLREAHELGLVHRDLKPDNIFLVESGGNPDFVKILDFGIAKAVTGQAAAERRTRLTEMGATLGTPWYMSPEQACAQDLDCRSDLYALGVMMYEMLSGALPFESDVGMQVLMQHVNDQPPPLPTHVGGTALPVELVGLTMELLEKSPDRRPANADEVAKRLKPWATRWTSSGMTAHVVEQQPPTPGQRSPLAETAQQPRALETRHFDVSQPTQKAPTVEPRPVASAAKGDVSGSRWIGGLLVAVAVMAVLAYVGFVGFADESPKSATPVALQPVGDETEKPLPKNAGPRGPDARMRPESSAQDAIEPLPEVAPSKGVNASVKDSHPTPDAANGEPPTKPAPKTTIANKPPQKSSAGKLSTRTIESVIGRKVRALKSCIEKHVAAGNTHALKVSMVIMSHGRVADARVTPKVGPVNGCIARVIRAITFPAHDAGKISYSFPLTAKRN